MAVAARFQRADSGRHVGNVPPHGRRHCPKSIARDSPGLRRISPRRGDSEFSRLSPWKDLSLTKVGGGRPALRAHRWACRRGSSTSQGACTRPGTATMEDSASPPGEDMQLEQLRLSLDSPDGARALLNSWNLRDPDAVEPFRHRRRPAARRLARSGAAAEPSAAALSRPGHDAQQSRTLSRPPGGRQAIATPHRESRPHPRNPAPAFQRQPVVQRLAERQSRLPRHAAVPCAAAPARPKCRPSSRPRWMPPSRIRPSSACSAVSGRGRLLRIGTNDVIRDRPLEEITRDISRVADVALEVALATALRHVGKRYGQPCTSAGRARLVRRPRVRQARGRGTELQQRHRPDVRLRGGRGDARQTDYEHRQRRILCPVVGEVVRLLSAAHRPRPGLSRRFAAAPGGAPRPAGPVAGQHAVLLRHTRPHLGTAGPHQAAARRPATSGWVSASSRPSSRSSIANI